MDRLFHLAVQSGQDLRLLTSSRLLTSRNEDQDEEWSGASWLCEACNYAVAGEDTGRWRAFCRHATRYGSYAKKSRLNICKLTVHAAN